MPDAEFDWFSESRCATCGYVVEAYELDMGECEDCSQSRWERICSQEEASFDFGIDNHLEAQYDDKYGSDLDM